MRRSSLGVAALLLAVGLAGCGGKQFEEELRRVKATTSAPEVPAVQLVSEYRANEVKADVAYKDTVIVVTGEVAQIKKDLAGHPVVVLTPGPGHGIVTVRCVFDKGAIEATARLNKGDTARIKGLVKGKLGSVNLDACVPG